MSTQRSSFYNSFVGETKNKFEFSNFRQNKAIDEGKFFQWTSGNMYRTSYNDMSKKVGDFYDFLTYSRANPLKERIVLFQNTRDTFQI